MGGVEAHAPRQFSDTPNIQMTARKDNVPQMEPSTAFTVTTDKVAVLDLKRLSGISTEHVLVAYLNTTFAVQWPF